MTFAPTLRRFISSFSLAFILNVSHDLFSRFILISYNFLSSPFRSPRLLHSPCPSARDVFSLMPPRFLRVCRFVPISGEQSEILPILDTFFVVNATLPSNKRHDFHPLCNSRLHAGGGSYPTLFLRQPVFTISPFTPARLPSRSPFAPHN